MDLYSAIHEMRELTKKEVPFSFTFMSYDRTRGRSSGIVSVRRAKLRPRGKEKYNEFAELQEEYLDLDTNEPRRFWHPLLMTFNGKKVSIP